MTNRSRLLLADDSALVKNNLKRLFSNIPNIDIYEANDVDSAKNQLDTVHPDIILLDLKMPGGSGLDVLDYLRVSSIDPVIIVLTNFAGEDNRDKCLQLGADYFFDKSEQHKEAIELVRRIVSESGTDVFKQNEQGEQ